MGPLWGRHMSEDIIWPWQSKMLQLKTSKRNFDEFGRYIKSSIITCNQCAQSNFMQYPCVLPWTLSEEWIVVSQHSKRGIMKSCHINFMLHSLQFRRNSLLFFLSWMRQPKELVRSVWTRENPQSSCESNQNRTSVSQSRY